MDHDNHLNDQDLSVSPVYLSISRIPTISLSIMFLFCFYCLSSVSLLSNSTICLYSLSPLPLSSLSPYLVFYLLLSCPSSQETGREGLDFMLTSNYLIFPMFMLFLDKHMDGSSKLFLHPPILNVCLSINPISSFGLGNWQ